MIRSVAIVGGGFSGALQAVNLVRHHGPRATLIERRAEAGRGVAYSAAHPSHLLNVRAGNMSAFPDHPDHFVRWIGRNGFGDAATFVPRIVYGRYLAELVREAQASHPDRLEIVHGEAVAMSRTGDGYKVRLADDRTVTADAAVLALGNFAPAPPPGLDADALPPGTYAPDPWAGDIADGLSPADTVLIVGTGLTMIDAALLLDARGFKGRMLALSRRGLLPRAHVAGGAPAAPTDQSPATGTSLLAKVRSRAQRIGWRQAVDELRPVTQSMWLAASVADQARFLRHLRPWWDVHRHRLAPEIAARLDELVDSGRLEIAAGKTLSFAAKGSGVLVRWRRRGAAETTETQVRRIVNCTGPQTDLDRTDEPLLLDLKAKGMIVADPLRLGLAVDAQARVIDACGRADDRLFALGPLTKGTFWEIVAVPDIRVQTWTLARRLSGAPAEAL